MHIVPDVHSSDENEEPAEQSRLRKAITAPWLGPILIVIGWGPLFAFDLVVDVLQRRGIVGPHFGVGYGMGWGTVIAVPATILGVCSTLVHLIRAVYRAIAWH